MRLLRVSEMQVACRIMGVEAAAALASLHAAGFSRPWPMEEFRALLAQPGVWALLCGEADGEAGFILMRAVAEEAEILTFSVDPPCRRRGMGRALLSAALAEAEKQGARAVFLEVSEENQAAISLYDGAGFARVGRRPGYYAADTGGEGESRRDALVMRRELR